MNEHTEEPTIFMIVYLKVKIDFYILLLKDAMKHEAK